MTMMTGESGFVDVRAHGAGRGGLDTRAVQSAIDACAGRGGGTVYVPPGRYVCGTIRLASFVTLHLEAGAVLEGSTSPGDYEGGEGGYLIYGEDLDGAALTGRGTIDGRGPSWWTSEMINATALRPKAARPRALVYLVNCRNTVVRDVSLVDSPFFTLWMLGGEGAAIDGVRIANPRNGPNTDGIDVDCCRDVTISNCRIDAGDDCIALKSNAKWLGRRQACENVVVSNCVLSSSTCAVRVGYEGDAPIRNCAFSNLAITDTHIGIDLVSILPADEQAARYIQEGVEIENVAFSNVVMDRAQRPIFAWVGNETGGPMRGLIADVAIRGLTARAAGSSYIGGLAGNPIRGFRLSDVRIEVHGTIESADVAVPDVWGSQPVPFGLYCRHVEGLTLGEVKVDMASARGPWRGDVHCEHVNTE